MSPLDAMLPAIVAGHPDAFARWVAGAEPRVRLSLGSFAGRVDVEAVVQESLLRVWQTAARIEVRPAHGGESSLRYAIRIARNLAIDELRRARLDATEAPKLERMLERGAGSHPAPPDPMVRQAVVDCVEALPRKPRAAFDARLEASGMRADSELAATVGMKTNTFLKNFGRARSFLVDCLRRRGLELDAAGRLSA